MCADSKPILFITGPTASGKTARAVSIARKFDGEIISADSRQLYRGMDLGTGKDLDEYDDIPYHLIDIVPAGYKYNLFEYLRDFDRARAEIENRGKLTVVCGGTGLYIESALKGLHLPEVPKNDELRQSLSDKTLEELTFILSQMKTLHNTTDIDTAKRAIRAIEIETYYQEHPEAATNASPAPLKNAVTVGVDIPRDARRQRISSRLKARLESGMVDEVRQLLDDGVKPEDLIYYGLEYKYLTLYLLGKLSYDEMYNGLEIAIHQFAKRQMTWFRGMERRGFKINWLPLDMSDEEFTDLVGKLLENVS
ncbi:MAG: tRNA (adenosine(37)-N6)-dimethylallyltransferase MiaA [Muribaculaceae bacterium]|nr:tRNA (adenosine(37)-N6)-dimethylallyltransferase MiaA [Muribaculaceae bacterium]